MQIRSLGLLTTLVSVMILVDALTLPIIMGSLRFGPAWYDVAVVRAAGTISNWLLAWKIATMLVFAGWIYVAGSNLAEAGIEDTEFTPASRIWWFFVPFANFVKPFQGMRELWNASHGNAEYRDGVGIVTAWWTLWLAGSAAAYVAITMTRQGSPNGSYLEAALILIRAPVAIAMLRGILRAQARFSPGRLEEVFG